MGILKNKIALAFGLAIIMVSPFPVFAVVYSQSSVAYNPGVSVGQYVKYGNFVALPTPPVGFGWMKIEVTAVYGKQITLLATGELENGTAIPTSGTSATYNVESGKMNETTDYTYGVIIAGNLNEGDLVPPLGAGFKVNKTETRTYNGVSRAVNIIETTYSDANYENHWTIVYDKIAGISLEFGFEVSQKSSATTTKTTYSVTETNLFSSSEPTASPAGTNAPESPEPTTFNLLPIEPLTAIIIVVVIVLVITAATLLLKKRR